MAKRITEQSVQDALIGFLQELSGYNNTGDAALSATEAVERFADAIECVGINGVRSFEDCTLLTRNKGLVLTLSNGAEFQITIVQSAYPQSEEEEQSCGA